MAPRGRARIHRRTRTDTHARGAGGATDHAAASELGYEQLLQSAAAGVGSAAGARGGDEAVEDAAAGRLVVVTTAGSTRGLDLGTVE